MSYLNGQWSLVASNIPQEIKWSVSLRGSGGLSGNSAMKKSNFKSLQHKLFSSKLFKCVERQPKED